jgi:2-oxoglutarate dehydrogenase E2 component (dihydrolipoamide succinyltransferase)
MSHSVQMPALGESVTEGTVTRWLKSEGDQVTEDEPLLEVSTDKVDTEVPAPYSGVLERILVAEDETVEIGAELAIIGDGSGGGSTEQAAPAEPAEAQAQPEPEAAAQSEQSGEAAPPQGSTEAEQPAATSQPAAPQSGGDGSGGDGGGTPQGTEVTMPAMGESVTEGTVTRWLKQVGDTVEVDEPLLEISTDKVDTEMPSPVGGTVLQILAQEDETVEVGAPLAIIGEAGAQAAPAQQPEQSSAQESAPAPQQPAAPEQPATPEPEPQAEAEPPAEAEPAQAPAEQPVQPRQSEPAAEAGGRHESVSAAATQAAPPAAPRPTAPAWQPPAGERGGAYVTPVVRKLAADSGVDLSTVTGTGVGGRIRREDVLAAAAAAQAAAARATEPAAAPGGTPAGASVPAVKPDEAATALIGTTQKTPRIRQSIARNMLTAMTTSAQLTTVIEVDVTRVAAVRQRAKAGFEAREGVKLSFLPFFVKAAVEAAKAYPIINSSLSQDLTEITYHPTVNMGIAVDTPRGLIVPVIKSADDLNIGGIARRIADLADRTRNNKIGPDELSGGTLTVTNTGSVGALFDTAIFVPPQSAILVVGAVVKRPVVVSGVDGNDVIAVRSMAYVALSYDHRTIDGADAARYLTAIKKRIEGGDFEAELGL